MAQPTKRRQTENVALTDHQVQHLMWGWVFFDTTDPNLFPFRDDAHRRELWNLHREQLMHHEDLSPGQTPRAYRDYDMPPAA